VAETLQSLEGLASLKPAHRKRRNTKRRWTRRPRLCHGKRKNAVARVWIKPGGGKIEVNTKSVEVFFARAGAAHADPAAAGRHQPQRPV